MGRSFKLVVSAAIWMVAIPALAVLAAGAVWLALAREAPLRYAEVARIELPLPPRSAQHVPAARVRGTSRA